MRNYKLTGFFILLLYTFAVPAAEDNYKIKIHPFMGIVAGPNAEVELFQGSRFGLAPAFYIISMGPDDGRTEGFDVGLNGYIYFRNNVDSGFFLSPFLHFLRIFKDSESGPGYGFPTGVTLGYQYVFTSKIVAAFEVGVATFAFDCLCGVLPLTSFTVGYDFRK